MRILMFLSLVMADFVLLAQSPVYLTPNDVKEDIQLIAKILNEAHPGLYRYQTEEHWQKTVAGSLTLEEPISQILFNYHIRQMLSEVQCGHTTSYIPRQQRMSRLYNDNIQVAPFVLSYIDGRSMIAVSLDPKLPQDATITHVNGHALDSLMNSWTGYSFQADAGIRSRTPYYIADEFNLMYTDLIDSPDRYTLTIGEGQTESQIVVSPVTTRKWRTARKSWQNDNHQPWFDYKVLHEGSVAYLRFRTFGDYQLENGERGKFKKFVNDSFKSMAIDNPKALIIDLRGNDGGEGRLGAQLYGLIARAPFKYFDRWETNVNKIPFDSYASISKVEKAAINGLLKKRLTAVDNGYQVKSWYGTLETQSPNALAYQGQVYILVDGRTFSAASDFVAVAKSNNRVIVIGEETGGAYLGNNSGVTINYKLPNSGLRVQVPLAAGYNKVSDIDITGGIKPDYETEPSKALEIALELINAN